MTASFYCQGRFGIYVLLGYDRIISLPREVWYISLARLWEGRFGIYVLLGGLVYMCARLWEGRFGIYVF